MFGSQITFFLFQRTIHILKILYSIKFKWKLEFTNETELLHQISKDSLLAVLINRTILVGNRKKKLCAQYNYFIHPKLVYFCLCLSRLVRSFIIFADASSVAVHLQQHEFQREGLFLKPENLQLFKLIVNLQRLNKEYQRVNRNMMNQCAQFSLHILDPLCIN